MRQIATNGQYYFHHDLDDRVVYYQVGFIWQWHFLLKAWDRFQRYQLIDCDDGFCAVADVVRGARREKFYIEDVVVDPAKGVTDAAIFAHPLALAELAAGCKELRDMMDADAEGTFLGYEASPLLERNEEFDVRQLIRRVMKVDDDRIVRFRRRVPETA